MDKHPQFHHRSTTYQAFLQINICSSLMAHTSFFCQLISCHTQTMSTTKKVHKFGVKS